MENFQTYTGVKEHYSKSLCTDHFTLTILPDASFFISTRVGFLSRTLITFWDR